MLSELKTGHKVVGVKQSRKAVTDGIAQTVYIARDAEEHIRVPIEELCKESGVSVVFYETMQELGGDCGIEVGAAVAALLK